MALSDELSEALAETIQQKQETEAGTWIPYLGPDGGEGWQNTTTHEVRYQQDPPGDVAEGYNDDYWNEQSESEGFYDEEAWSEALWEEGWTSPGDVPEGTAIEFETSTGATARGLVQDVQWGEQFESWPNDPAAFEVETGSAEFLVGPDQILGILDAGPEEEAPEPPKFDWDTDVPRIDELQEGADVLYVGEDGIRRVGTFDQPDFVQTAEGTFPGMQLEEGGEIRLEQVVAVDEGPVELVPRDDPYEFEDEVDPHQRGLRDPGVTWLDALEYTPFDTLGEVPIGATVSIDANNHPDAPGVNGTLEGEVTGYWEGDAEINEPNGLEVEVPDHGKMVVFPDDVAGFIGPEGELDTAQYLSDPFNHAVDVTGSRQAGIGDGNTTGGRMKILTMPDDSRVFATPLEAYNNISTGVVSGAQEAKRNNLNSPIMIDHLGGHACKTEDVEDEDGKKFIAKEGIEGDLLKSRQWDIDEEDDAELIESLEKTLATAFFVGNKDLHGANVMVNFETQEATIIDHDSAGPSYGGWMDVYRLHRGPTNQADIEENIYDICRDYMRGDLDVPPELEGTFHEDHFKSALDSIVSDPDHDEVWDEWDTGQNETVDGYSVMDAFEPGMEVSVFTSEGRVRRATLTDFYQGEWYGESDDGYEVSFPYPENVLEVHGDVEPADAPEYEMSEFEEGDKLTVSPDALSAEDVVVEEYDDKYDRLRVHPEGDPQDVFHVNLDEEIDTVRNESDNE